LIGGIKALAAAEESGCCTSEATLKCVFFFFFSWGPNKHPGDPKKVEVPMMQRTFFEAKNGQQVGLVVVTF
jgi:hypothetical protein